MTADVSVRTVMQTASTISPKAVFATIFGAVSPYIGIVLLQYQDTGSIDAANLRALLVGLVTGVLTFISAYLADPGQTKTVLENDNPEPDVLVNDELPPTGV